MNSSIRLIPALILCLFLIGTIQSNEAEDLGEEEATVTIMLIKFDVNDKNLELGWKITNATDHDIWICETMNTNAQLPKFETFMAQDVETLVIRRRFDVPLAVSLERPIGGRYVRLRPGQDRVEYLTFPVPVIRDRLFETELGNARYAKRLVLETGFYNDDLPGLLLHIAEVAEKLNCVESSLRLNDIDIYARYFGGFWIAGVFNDDNYVSAQLREAVIEESDEIVMPHMGKARIGEQVLRMTIDNVSIPYNGLVPSTDEPQQNETELAGVTTVLTKLVVDDQNFEMGWKIVNNTDHDVWICDSSTDRFMYRDNETLVIRMRYNISNQGVIWEIPPNPRFWYSRLRPGEQKVKSIALAVPVEPRAKFKTSRGNAEHARRVALEIGYYDEDLRALILEIVNVAERLGCDASAISFPVPQSTKEVYNRFFGGVRIAQLFNSPNVEHFHDSVTSGGDEIIAPYFRQALHGEQVLRLEVDNVSIPYESNYPPLND